MNVMRDQPGMAEGLEVPFNLAKLLKENNQKAADEFAASAQKTLQR